MQPIKPSNYLFVQQHDITVAAPGTAGLTHYFSFKILFENGITLSLPRRIGNKTRSAFTPPDKFSLQ
jgi:hypothetical protein